MSNKNMFRPGMSPRDLINKVRSLPGVGITSTGMRDAGQSDFKNRLRIHDLETLAPYYERMDLFSAEVHGGARWHVGIMNRRESPFEETAILREKMPNVLLQTLVRETSLWGYRPYPKNVINFVISQVDIDIWRCFSFLNDVRNMRTICEVVMERGLHFQPAVSFTQADWATNEYYINVVNDMVDLCGGVDEIVMCIKDMAGVGSPERIRELVDTMLQKYPEMVIQYHRHSTDGLGLPALLAAAQAGAKLLDAQEDSLTRFYGQPPILSLHAYLEEAGIPVHLNRPETEAAVQTAREWIRQYGWAESPFKGTDHTVVQHRMPGGAFPSSFEQAEQGGFLHLMPMILKVMSLYNRIVHYFDVTPGSQMTWVTCSGTVNRYAKEFGIAGVHRLIALLTRFTEEVDQDLERLEPEEKAELMEFFVTAPGDFKNLIQGGYGKLPAGWPADWVYESVFGEQWKEKLAERSDASPLDSTRDEDLDAVRADLAAKLEWEPTEEEFILYLMHPKDTVDMIHFREEYGEASMVLPTSVWHSGLEKPGDTVDFTMMDKPHTVEMVSVGEEHEGYISVVLRINNQTRVFTVETPRVVKTEIRMARAANEVGSPITGSIWRLGNPKRGDLAVGDIVHEGEEIANIEAMKMENVIAATLTGHIAEICIQLNDSVIEGQLLYVLEEEK
ncbi:MAG: biotin/lipoyl-containing protein [bacterium]|nr:biotin attachment protein [bacterium]MDT8366102.1 biotin/lipoyl-containing protein [bacterium]